MVCMPVCMYLETRAIAAPHTRSRNEERRASKGKEIGVLCVYGSVELRPRPPATNLRYFCAASSCPLPKHTCHFRSHDLTKGSGSLSFAAAVMPSSTGARDGARKQQEAAAAAARSKVDGMLSDLSNAEGRLRSSDSVRTCGSGACETAIERAERVARERARNEAKRSRTSAHEGSPLPVRASTGSSPDGGRLPNGVMNMCNGMRLAPSAQGLSPPIDSTCSRATKSHATPSSAETIHRLMDEMEHPEKYKSKSAAKSAGSGGVRQGATLRRGPSRGLDREEETGETYGDDGGERVVSYGMKTFAMSIADDLGGQYATDPRPPSAMPHVCPAMLPPCLRHASACP